HSISRDISFVWNNKIYRGLGYDEVNGYLSNFQVFDLAINNPTWSAGPIIRAQMQVRELANCFTINNTAYIGMGANSNNSNLSDWWSFDGQTWTSLTASPEKLNTVNGFSFV